MEKQLLYGVKYGYVKLMLLHGSLMYQNNDLQNHALNFICDCPITNSKSKMDNWETPTEISFHLPLSVAALDSQVTSSYPWNHVPDLHKLTAWTIAMNHPMNGFPSMISTLLLQGLHPSIMQVFFQWWAQPRITTRKTSFQAGKNHSLGGSP